VADQSTLEFYKLAAQIIPVLWIGNVLQRLDPTVYAAEVDRAAEAWSEFPFRGDMADALEQAADRLEARAGSPIREYVQTLRGRAQEDFKQKLFAESRARNRAAGAAWIALPVLLVAALSETAALIGVAADFTVWWVTLIVTAGLVGGGLLLLFPLVLQWWKLR
jgi:hypothetical protein